MIIGRLSVRSEERRDLRKKIGKRRQIESGGYPGNTIICLVYYSKFLYTQIQRGGAKDLFIMILRTK